MPISRNPCNINGDIGATHHVTRSDFNGHANGIAHSVIHSIANTHTQCYTLPAHRITVTDCCRFCWWSA